MNPKTRRHVTEGWKPADWDRIERIADPARQEELTHAALLRYERPLFRLLVAHLEELPEQEAYDYAMAMDRTWREDGIRYGNPEYEPPYVADLDNALDPELTARYALGFHDGEPAAEGYQGDDDPGAWLRAYLRKRVDHGNGWILDERIRSGTFDDFWTFFA